MFDIENFPTREMAKTMLGMVSPIYDEAYVGKWIFQILGLAMELASDTIHQLEEEAFPNTATSATLDLWEKMYGIEVNTDLSDEERRARILLKRNYRRPMNPARIAALAMDATGRQAYVRENTAPYTYEICIQNGSSNAVLDSVRAAVEAVQQPKKVVIAFTASPGIKIRAEPFKVSYSHDDVASTLRIVGRRRL